MTSCYFLDREAFRKVDDARLALAKQRGADPEWLKANKTDYGWANLSEVTSPCPMWFAYWYFDPEDPDDKEQRDYALKAIADGTFDKNHSYLSRFYWQQWSDRRPTDQRSVPEWRRVVRRCGIEQRRGLDGDGWGAEHHLSSEHSGHRLSRLAAQRGVY